MLRVVVLVGAATAAITTTAGAGEEFTLNVTPGTFSGRYDGAQYRDSIQGSSVSIEGHSSQWGFAAASEHTRIQYKYGLADFEQDAGFLSGHVSYTPPHAKSVYSFGLDFHSIRDNDNSLTGDDAQVMASQISYARLNNSVYVDLGYAHSRYESNAFTPGALSVDQWTPTLGFALTHGATNWVKLRGYFIHSSNPFRSQYIIDTAALEVKYLYYPLSAYKVIPQYIELGGLSGDRIYAVDRDTASVDNLAELEKGGVFLTIKWQLIKSVGLQFSQSYNKFRETTATGFNDYKEKVTWLGLVAQW